MAKLTVEMLGGGLVLTRKGRLAKDAEPIRGVMELLRRAEEGETVVIEPAAVMLLKNIHLHEPK